MKKNILSLILLVLVFSSAFATKHNHADENEVRYVKKNVELNPQYQQQLRNTEMWQNFMAENPNWFVIFNENNQMPHRAFGAPIQINDLFSFLATNNFVLPVDLREYSSTKNDKYINKTYVQYYNNLEVVNSKLYAKFSLASELISFGLDIFNDINISIVPTINEPSAIASATSNISASISDIIVNENLKILANPKYRKHEYNLVYVVKFKTRIDEGPAHYICYVDAHTGELLMRKNEVMYEAPPITTNVSGDVYTTHPYNPSSSEKFKYLKAIDQSTNMNYYTDANGDVDFGTVASGTSIRYKLEGNWSDVQTNNNTPDIVANLGIGTTNNIIFDNTNSTIQERTAYYAVNMIHNHLKSVFPTFTGLDSPLETNVDEQGSCNAFFSGGFSPSINFYAEGGGCHATAKIPDVAYHEYGHAINNARYNSGLGMSNGAMNEGFADVWALSLTETPVLGFGWDLVDPTVYVRRYDQDRKVYPQDLAAEVHADGEIIAGCFWDTYLNLGNMTQMLDLFKYTYDSGVDGADGTEGVIYTDILLEVLYADDNDADISNGTPNDCAIVSAFALHGITMLSNAVISHNPISVASGNTAININASVGITYPWCLSSANCFYRLNDATTWNNLAMSGTSSPTTTIPAQPNGTVIAYYISLTDNYGNELGVTPQAANLTPIHNANIPYFIMVGYELMQEEDFDFNFGFWQTGDVNDNATTGMWEIGTPIPSYGDPSSFSGIVQTGTQHTSGGSQCAFTGNASSYMDGIGTQDVDDGHTTLFSPYYDLTEYANPAFSYYRWYTNSPGSGANPGADWWQVLITDDGVNWHYVENNMSSDINWRKVVFRVQDYVSLTNIVQLKFIASDSTHLGQNLDGGSLIEGAVDDLYLYEAQEHQTNVLDLNVTNPKLVRVTDLLGREMNPVTIVEKTTLFYIYDDGTVEKRIILE